ncbi:hypothetical protein DV515_00002459 [Chloebia gouldiae]|uniref:Protein SPT2 homolog n=1 Tax=Chloebia gouldiae TaxID=44316 RepID=A0A3L8SWH7_CHLGU|nr:hypothetical protein DV515_00002459 [Chloebia gouldiae]
MDFHNILVMASEQQGLNAVPKRYSLAVGPPKKVPKVKGVESAAVQAFLRRQEEEKRKKALEERRKKEQLLARRIELKHDRKARAMASRTKDNFYGYNGVPVEEKPKKRRACENVAQAPEAEYATEDETEQLEYSQTESEHEQEEYEDKPSKAAVKPKAPLKSAPAPLNFAELLRLAEKKQYEPVEIKPVKKVEERPRTAEELRERELLGRKNKKVEMHKKNEKEIKPAGISSSSKKLSSQKASVNTKLNKSSVDKHSTSKSSLSLSMGGIDKKSKAPALTEKHPRSSSSSRLDQMEKNSQNGSLKSSTSSSHNKLPVNGIRKSGSNSHVPPSKPMANGAQKMSSAKESSLKKSAHAKPGKPAALQHGINSNAKRSGSSLGKGGPGHPGGGLGRPPISYKRQIEDDDDDDEYDSEMDDFIEDEGEPQEEISKHIREIFGYDRKRYKDESDYALRYMESSWREQQKEEARSLRLGVQEDLEELRREEEELKRKRQSKKLRTR